MRLQAMVVLAGLLAGPAAASAPPPESARMRLVPDRAVLDPTIQAGPRGSLDTTTRGLRIRLEPLDPAGREAFFGLRTEEGFNVLPAGAAGDPFTVFALSFENGTGKDVTFLTSTAALRDQNDAEVSPLPTDALFQLFRAAFEKLEDPDKAARQAQACVHGEALVLRHGQLATRLLVFPPPPKGARRVVLSLEHLMIGDEVITPTFPYVLVGGEGARR